MDYTYLFKNGKQPRVGIVGATKGYGYTLLAQLIHIEKISLRAICSRHIDECYQVLKELGYDETRFVLCTNEAEIGAVPEDGIVLASDPALLLHCGITSLVECTGSVAISTKLAMDAMEKGINVYMVSKETDSVFGPMFNRLASITGSIYTLVNGDQPRNLIDLYTWAKMLGLEIICAGKSSEYDFVFDPETARFSYLTQTEELPLMKSAWHYTGAETLQKRRMLLEKYAEPISADMCEMNLVSNVTGLKPAKARLNYPIAKTSELADIFIPKEDGGILDQTGVIDVFFNLRAPDEASFAGGEFVIVKCCNEKVWAMLKEKGHIVSRNGKYACLYRPYHYMGMETPASILLGDILGIGTHPECRYISVMAGVAAQSIPAGTTFSVQGHHHEIAELSPELVTITPGTEAIIPFYLLHGAVTKRQIPKGTRITFENIEPAQEHLVRLYKESISTR